MKQVTIEILSPNHAILREAPYIDFLRQKLMYHETIFRPTPGKGAAKTRKEFPTYLVSKLPQSRGMFLLGFLQMAKEHFIKAGFKVNVVDPAGWESYGKSLVGKMKLPPGLVHRDHQAEALKISGDMRGIVVNPTGSGKTILGFSWLSRFSGPVLFIVHTKDLLSQTVENARKWGFKDVGIIGDGKKSPGNFTVGMVQTLAKLANDKEFDTRYKMWLGSIQAVVVDEVHHVSSFSGQYAQVLIQLVNTWHRLGLTATESPDEEAKMAVTGFLGPKLHTVRMAPLVDAGVLARPKIILKMIPEDAKLRQCRDSYAKIYEKRVIQDRPRNRSILLEVRRLVREENLTVLVVVTKAEHGEILYKMIQNMYPELRSDYVWGNLKPTDRERIRTALDDNLLDVVISTTVWKEGVDIPTLGAIVNAAGGKSEIAVLQNIGRGTRAPKGKTEVLIVDFFDNSHHHLVSHFGQRLCLYFREGWL